MKGVATVVVLTILAGGGIRAVQFYRSGEILSDVSFTQKVKYLENMIDEEYLGDISTDDLKEGVYAGLIYGLDDVYSRYYTERTIRSGKCNNRRILRWNRSIHAAKCGRWSADRGVL